MIFHVSAEDNTQNANAHDFEDQHASANYSNPFRNFGNNGNNASPRTPRSHLDGYVSPPRHSHHGQHTNWSQHGSEVANDVTSEDIIKFQQDDYFQKCILKSSKQNGDQYLTYLTSKGWKILHDFDVKG